MILKTLIVLLLAGLVAAQATVTDMFIGIGEPQPEGLVASVVGGNADETTYLVTCVTPQQTTPVATGCSLAAGLTVIAEPSTTQVFSTATGDEYIGYESIICSFDHEPLVTCTQTTHMQPSPMRSYPETWGSIDQAAGYALVTQNLTRFPVTITAGGAVTPTATATTDEVFTLFSSSVPTATLTISHAAGTAGSGAKNHTSVAVTSTSSGTLTSTANGTEHASSTRSVTSSKSQGAGPLITGEAMVVAGVAAVALAAAVVL